MAVDATVSFAVQTIGDLLIQEAQFVYGVSDQVQNIQRELRRMQCFLKDADSKASNGDERVRNWLAEIRDLAYDAEDVIETYALKVESRRRREGIMNVLKRYACILNEGITLYKVGSEIEAITTKISNLTTSLQNYGIQNLNDGGSSSADQKRQHLRRTVSYVVDRNVVGQDESIEELVKHLIEENYRIVSIWGMGGLGKTTLARKVYHHAKVKSRFDSFAWSCISKQFKERDVWEGILIKLVSPSKEQRDEIAQLRDEEVAKKIYQVLQEKRCLVILDDIWNIEAWDSLRNAFPDGETNSKILLTTRNEDVALHADPTGFRHKPRCLTDEESWKLLQKIAIPQKDDIRIETKMEELGRTMAKHCGGLPLAVTVLGGLLATKDSSEWQRVDAAIKSCLRRGTGHGQEDSGVSDVLTLSYNDLPTELKPCFLYLSHFPEDYEIPVDRLIQLWVAEGIIKLKQHNNEEGEETAEDVAERYFNELAKRCMVIVGERATILMTKICRMHDLMRDLCLSKAKEENFIHIVNSGNGNENVDIFPSSSSGKIRRLTIYLHRSRNEGILKGIKNPYHLRTLLCFSEYEYNEKWSLEMPVFNNLKLLRALAVEGRNMRVKLPKDIGKLIHLRFLSLMDVEVWELPLFLGNLRCLQTLDLRIDTDVEVHIPNVLWKMEDLRHLYLPETCDDKTKLRLGNLRNLQTLVNFSFKNFDVSELLNNMTNLRELAIQHLILIEDFGETFKSRNITLKHLRSLTLFTTDIFTMDPHPRKIDVGPLISGCVNVCGLNLHGPIEKLPDDHQLPTSITEISLWKTNVREDPMATLKKLPNLRNLSLNDDAFIGKQMVCSGEGFPRLHSLILYWLSNLEEWRVDEGVLPNLYHFKIIKCEKLKTLPDGLRFVKTLKELEIIMMPKEFKEKLVEGGEDFYKVQHVPSVIFKEWQFFSPT